MRKLAHYYYSCGSQLQVFADRRKITILDETNRHPISPITGNRTPVPDSGDWSYEAMGLYFGYGMLDVGWDGDC
jgi:hypothetical protein